MSGQRADLLLVELGLFDSRARARAAIEAGLVTADGAPVAKPAQIIARGARISAAAPHPYVSRGGVKLAAALDAFGINPRGLPCLDVGASTGGFSDCLLQRGAAHVTAVDTGRGQLHERLKGDPHVTAHESCDIRAFQPDAALPRPRLAVIDVSFISVRLVLPAVARLLAPEAWLVALVKPQFEVGKGRVGRGGIVKDVAARAQAAQDVRETLVSLGFTILGVIDSPIAGGDGNVEQLIGARRAAQTA